MARPGSLFDVHLAVTLEAEYAIALGKDHSPTLFGEERRRRWLNRRSHDIMRLNKWNRATGRKVAGD